MSEKTVEDRPSKYPLPMRCLHWIRAALIIGLIASGWYMTRLPESEMATALVFYPNHKQFGMLVWLIAVVHIALRWRYSRIMPTTPAALTALERILAHTVHRLLILMIFLVPLFGYLLSSTFTQSDGVPFFFISRLPEFLPKNDDAFALFQLLHRVSAYLLLALTALHICGAIKHRLTDKGGSTDVIPRMV
ncbi:cytochrome b [Rhizobium helianthi]|uniref:Cytochrome b n=1 Tax=Rhizobium helianthi TaxID=1132695 RepID=A0ABW4M968_9HYPH